MAFSSPPGRLPTRMGMQGPPPSVDPTKYCVDVRHYGCVVVIVATFDYSALSEQFSRPYQNGLPMGRGTICHMTGACSGYIPRARSLPGSSLQVPALRTDSLERPRRRNKAHVSDPDQWRAAVHDAGAHVSPLPDDGTFAHPEQDRCVTLREAGLLQGFPPKYHFSYESNPGHRSAPHGAGQPDPDMVAVVDRRP